MKTYFKRLFIFTAIIFSFQVDCIKEDEVYTEHKRALLQHNYLIVNTIDGTPAEVEVSYSVYIAGNKENTVITERKTTPFVIGGEKVMAKYDSIYESNGRDRWHLYNEPYYDYQPKGSDYLVIKNTSTTTLEYAVVGAQEVRYYALPELNRKPLISRKEPVNINKMLKDYPLPIYKGTPVLYLFKPELAPQTDVFTFWENLSSDDNTRINKITLKTPTFGSVTLNTPMSITDVLALYKEEFENGNTLFDSYSTYYSHLLGEPNRSLKTLNWYVSDGFWYGKLSAGQELINEKGKINFTNLNSKPNRL